MQGEPPVQSALQSGAKHAVKRAAGAIYRSIVERLAGSRGDYGDGEEEDEPEESEGGTAEADSSSVGVTEGESTALVTPRESVSGADFASMPSIPRSVK